MVQLCDEKKQLAIVHPRYPSASSCRLKLESLVPYAESEGTKLSHSENV